MNVLVVNDQPTVVESLKREVRWDEIPVTKVYTATSAREARMVIRNFDVDVLLTDIEMPEEDGLSLFRWMKEEYPHIEGVFITAHADFGYAQEAIHMGGFDYILQPFRGEDVVNTLQKLAEKLNRQRVIHTMQGTPEQLRSHRNNQLDGLLRKLALGKDAAAQRDYEQLVVAAKAELGEVNVYPLLLEIVNWRGIGHNRGEAMLPQFFTNVLEDIFEDARGRVTISSLEESRYWMLLTMQQGRLQPEGYRSGIEEFNRFVRNNMEFQLALYPSRASEARDLAAACRQAMQRANANRERKAGVFWESVGLEDGASDVDIVRRAKTYIAHNLSRNVTRADVAAEVHLNEEYFSRLFSRQTGFTFKDYLLGEKMREARKLLETSSLPVSIVASKVGYDNFSHFSQIFKKLVGESPQEYRRNHKK